MVTDNNLHTTDHGLKPHTDRCFIDAESISRIRKGAFAGSDVYLSHRDSDGRVVLVLTRGSGSGIQANVVASVIASMIINYTRRNEPALRAARSVLDTFSGKDRSTDAAFAVVDIQPDGMVRMAEYDTPQIIVLRAGKILEVNREKVEIQLDESRSATLYISNFQFSAQDRIVSVTQGVADSGVGTLRLPQGWSRTGVCDLCLESIGSTPDISAQELALKIVARAEMNDLFRSKSDMSAMVVYFREPRRLLLCSGPPFNEANDRRLAEKVAAWPGAKVISGGTTATIISRELKREVTVNLRRDPSGLPPTSQMEGVDMVTEGVLTLAKVKSLLERTTTSEIIGQGTDYDLTRLLLTHDSIEFMVGTRINAIHQDPNLPVELELRRNVVKEIRRLLETKFMKEVKTEYI